jgi:hypothetical protein
MKSHPISEGLEETYIRIKSYYTIWWQPNRISLILSPYQLKGQSLMVAAPSYHTMGPYTAD